MNRATEEMVTMMNGLAAFAVLGVATLLWLV